MSRRKRQSHDEELPFVALMDTMTNVVGNCLASVVVAKWEGEFRPEGAAPAATAA